MFLVHRSVRKMKKIKFLVVMMSILLLASIAIVATPVGIGYATPTVIDYGDVPLTGGFQSGHFDEVWDLTKCDMVISFTLDLNGVVDEDPDLSDWAGGDHAWSELGIRQVGYSDFNPTWMTEGAGVWLATDYDEKWPPAQVNTFDPDPPGSPSLDLDDKLILQKGGGKGEGDYNLPSTPPNPGWNHRVWWDRDGVDPWQNDETANTGGIYNVEIELHATSDTTGTAYMTINGLNQGFETDGDWSTIELTPAGMTFTGDMTHMQVFYGLYGYGADHSVTFEDIMVTGCLNLKGCKEAAISKLETAKTGDKKVDDKLDKAIYHIEKSLEEDLWVDDAHLEPKHGKKVFDEEKKAVKEMMHLVDKEDTPQSVKDACQSVIDQLVEVDDMIAHTAYDEAKAFAGCPKVDEEVEKCEEEFGKAQEQLDHVKKDGTPDPKYDKAIDHYKKAWEHAQKALKKVGKITEPGTPDGSQGTYWWHREDKWTGGDFWRNKGGLKLSDGKIHVFTWRCIDDSEITDYDGSGKEAWQVFVMDAGQGSHGWEQIALQTRKDEPWVKDYGNKVIRAFVNWGGLGQAVVPADAVLDLRLVLQQNIEDDNWHIEAWYDDGSGWTQFVNADDVDISTEWSGLPGDLTQACAAIQIDAESSGPLYFSLIDPRK